MAEKDFIDIVFDGPPGPEAGRFVEVEDAEGDSIRIGRWEKRPDGYDVLRIDVDDFKNHFESRRTPDGETR